MSTSKDELYRLLVESSPFGILFFVYGVCIKANPKALQLLACHRQTLVGTSIDDINLEESIGPATFRECLRAAIKANESRKAWTFSDNNQSSTLNMDIRSVWGGSRKEIVVTLYDAGELICSLDDKGGIHGSTTIDQPARPLVEEIPDLKGIPSRETILRKLKGISGITLDPINCSSEDHHAVSPIATSMDSKLTSDGKLTQETFEELPVLSLDDNLKIKEIWEIDREWSIYHDSLTGLPNRQALLDGIRDYFGANRDQAESAALMLIDLDYFKEINHSWGHDVGDAVLIKIGQVLQKLTTDQTVLARMSGDEFAFFIPSLGSSLTEAAYWAREIATTVSAAIVEPVFVGGNEFILTASIGISLINDKTVSAERSLQYADTAMYEAKHKGRNGFAFFDPSIRIKAQRQFGLNTRLRKAVDNQEFTLFIQPLVDIDNGRVVGGEALLRWINADRVINMPSEFIPLLEASGLIVDVGHWVIRAACESLRGFIDDQLWRDDMRLGINVSPRQFKDPRLIEVIKDSLVRYDIDPRYLNFEITENLVVDDIEDAIKKMEAIKALGTQFSVDDFGVGYSSMIYLKRLPFDHLKIDREFISNIHRDPDSRAIVEAIMAVSRQYGLDVIAEGVEEQGALDVLSQVGCETYQGALFSMPVPVQQFKALLAA